MQTPEQNTEPVRVRLWVETQYVGTKREDEIEIPRDEWDGMTPAGRVGYLEEEAQNFRDEFVDYGWVIDDDADRASVDGES